MIEPTESENKAELDRFCDAMIHIRKEISEVEQGTVDAQNNVLTNAPHTEELLIAETWTNPIVKKRLFFHLNGSRNINIGHPLPG